MKTRPIDANQLYRIEKLLDTDIVKKDKVASELLEQVLYDIQHMPTLTPQNEPRMINADKLAKRIAGHSNYHGDSILAAIYCAAEGQENDAPIRPIEITPNEWVSVETPPTEQGWYHVAILDLKTGKYNVEQDLYSIELAKKHGFEPGFCKENRWKERERIDYWCRFPSPPESRPPEGEE